MLSSNLKLKINAIIHILGFMGLILYASQDYKAPVKDVPGCFPDYRPFFKCFVFEKLP
jgi:hypothetical protein